MGPALPPGFSLRYEPTDGSHPREVNSETGAVMAKQQTGNALHTHATEHGSEPRSRLACRGAIAFVFLGCKSNRPNGGGVGLKALSKRAKKHSIAADCGGLKATFGPHLRCAAEQHVKQ